MFVVKIKIKINHRDLKVLKNIQENQCIKNKFININYIKFLNKL